MYPLHIQRFLPRFLPAATPVCGKWAVVLLVAVIRYIWWASITNKGADTLRPVASGARCCKSEVVSNMRYIIV